MRIALLLTLLLGGLFSCGPERYTWNQRMTVTVETPEGVVSGSSVMEVGMTSCPNRCGLAREVTGSASLRGEAVAVEVRPGEWLFALIGTHSQLIYHARPDLFDGIPRQDIEVWAALVPQSTVPVELDDGLIPTLVTFTDRRNPRTAIEVTPQNIESIFGEGVSLNSVTLEVTEDEPYFGLVSTLLPSLGTEPGERLVDEVFPRNPSFPQSLQTGFFIRRDNAK